MIPSLKNGFLYQSEMIKALRRQGFAVQVFTGVQPTTGPLITTKRFRAKHLIVRSITGYPKGFYVVSPSLISQLIGSRPHVIFTVEYSMATVWSVIAARVTGSLLVIFQEHARRHGGMSLLRRVYRRWLARRADFIVANTPSARLELTGVLGIDDSAVVEAPWLSPPPRESLLGARAPQLPAPVKPCFLFVGDLSRRKNVQILLQAAGILRSRGLTFSVLVVGDGDQRESLDRLAGRLGLHPYVTFLGRLPYDQMGHLYELCDVFIMPTLGDYRSVSVLEAMRFGRALLVSSLDGNAGDTALDDENAFIFDPQRHPSFLADFMERFVTDDTLARVMGRRSEALIRDQTSAMAAFTLRRAVEERTGRR